MESTIFQISSRPRHFRYVYFIGENYPCENLIKLMDRNQRIWGGRYNPIIPVANNEITDAYKKLIKWYDPDVVFYSEEIDSEVIKKLKVFNPSVYVKLENSNTYPSINGISTLYFLSKFDKNLSILSPVGGKIKEANLLNFYKINFSLESNNNYQDLLITKNYKTVQVSEFDFKQINELIYNEKPINIAHLSRISLNTNILRSLEHARYDSFEIVVAKNENSKDDLFYFWNRLLYECRNVLYITIEELVIMSSDQHFGALIHQMNYENTVYVVSKSLSETEINDLIKTYFRKSGANRFFLYKNIDLFPFDILDANALHERDYGELITVQMLNFRQGIYYIPQLSFMEKHAYTLNCAMDIEIRKSAIQYTKNRSVILGRDNNYLKYSYNTSTNIFFGEVKGRINKSKNISLLLEKMWKDSNILNISIPRFENYVSRVMHRPFINGQEITTKYVMTRLHDSSYRLLAFIKLFEGNFDDINNFFTDKFWVSIFEKLSFNNKSAGEAISFQEIKAMCLEILEEGGIQIGERSETRYNIDNLEKGLRNTIEDLCNYKIFLIGFKMKCTNCSSIFWYHVSEVDENIKCKGCLEQFQFPLSLAFLIN